MVIVAKSVIKGFDCRAVDEWNSLLDVGRPSRAELNIHPILFHLKNEPRERKMKFGASQIYASPRGFSLRCATGLPSVGTLPPKADGFNLRNKNRRTQKGPPIFYVPKGIRTPVAAVKGQCPRPLDDGDI